MKQAPAYLCDFWKLYYQKGHFGVYSTYFLFHRFNHIAPPCIFIFFRIDQLIFHYRPLFIFTLRTDLIEWNETFEYQFHSGPSHKAFTATINNFDQQRRYNVAFHCTKR